MTLAGKVALVTGAGSSRGLGNAIARSLAGAGATVVLADVDIEGAARNAALIGEAARAVSMDVTDERSVQAGVREIGRVDILVNNAGITQRTPIWELSIADFDRLLSINLRGGFVCLKAVVAGMMTRRWGRIIWISSVAGKQGGGIIGPPITPPVRPALSGSARQPPESLAPTGSRATRLRLDLFSPASRPKRSAPRRSASSTELSAAPHQWVEAGNRKTSPMPPYSWPRPRQAT